MLHTLQDNEGDSHIISHYLTLSHSMPCLQIPSEASLSAGEPRKYQTCHIYNFLKLAPRDQILTSYIRCFKSCSLSYYSVYLTDGIISLKSN